MPKRRKGELIQGRYFAWILIQRRGFFYADGRSNQPSAGRHSLGTRSHPEALKLIPQLDEKMAHERGLIARATLEDKCPPSLSLEEGRKMYNKHLSRPPSMGGTTKGTQARYRAVFDKFVPFARSQRVFECSAITARLVEDYARHLRANEYSDRSIYLEVTVLKQLVKFLVEEKLLPEACRLRFKQRKVQGERAYCWSSEEVEAMLRHCEEKGLMLFRDLIGFLVYTGCRISEVIQLRWTDVDFEKGHIRIVDESSSSRSGKDVLTTKNHQSRTLPLRDELRRLLEQRRSSSNGNLVFATSKGKRLKYDRLREQFVKRVIRPLAARFPKEPGTVGFVDGRFHSFRHFFCSTCAHSRVPEPTVREWLGHRDSEMIRHYFHLHDDEAQRQMSSVQFPVAKDGSNGQGVKL